MSNPPMDPEVFPHRSLHEQMCVFFGRQRTIEYFNRDAIISILFHTFAASAFRAISSTLAYEISLLVLFLCGLTLYFHYCQNERYWEQRRYQLIAICAGFAVLIISAIIDESFRSVLRTVSLGCIIGGAFLASIYSLVRIFKEVKRKKAMRLRDSTA